MKFAVKFTMKSAVKSVMKNTLKSIKDIHSEICNEFNEILQNSVVFSKILLDLMKSFEISGFQLFLLLLATLC